MRNVIVGVDGTAGSRAALQWAAEAVGTSGRLHAVVAVNPWTERLVDAIGGRAVSFHDVLDRELVEAWTAAVGFAVGELQTSVSSSPAATALEMAATADDADAIVIGRHRGLVGRDGGGLVHRIGHLTNRLVRSTQHAVIVVPPEPAPPIDGGNIVVGIGHGDATRSAVRWVGHLARSRHLDVELLHATGDAPVFQAEGPVDLARHEFGGGDHDAVDVGRVEHFAALMQTVAGPRLEMRTSTPSGLAAYHLAEASERSSLVVIGRHRSKWDRGHHTAQPLRYLLSHAACPVAVIVDHPVDQLVDHPVDQDADQDSETERN